MRVFILGTGRCGTLSFARACAHLTRFSAGHESRSNRINEDRLAYSDRHIEADPRLAWFLGPLGRRFPDAFYVHLRRDREATAASFLRRWPAAGSSIHRGGIVGAFAHAIVMHGPYREADRLDACRFYVDTVTTNIEEFLRDRPHMTIDIETAAEAFPEFAWRIGAEGDLTEAIAEFGVHHNSSAAIEAAFAQALAARQS